MKPDSQRRFLRVSMAAIFVSALLAVPIAGALYFFSGPFRWKNSLTFFFCAAGIEKIWAMFFRCRQRGALEAASDWTAAAVGAAYAALMYGALAELYMKRSGVSSPALALAGACVYVSAIILRYSAFARLRGQWAIHLDRELPDRRLIRGGAYAAIRHPLYLAYCIEALCVPLVMHAFWSFAFGLLVFVPLEVYRAYYEERFLFDTFGDDYRDYAGRVWAFFPLPFGKKRGGIKDR